MLRDMRTGRRSLALAAPHTAATEAGVAAFADGGTAVDAALAACATLTVAYLHMCSIGGDAIALLHAPDGTVTAVNGSGAAPAALDAARVRAALERDPAPVTRTGMPIRGPHTVTVPGVLAAWETLRQLGGALPLDRLLRPAIGLAADGCRVSRSLAAALAEERCLFARDPGLRAAFFRPPETMPGGAASRGAPPDATPLGEGDLYRLPALAESLDAIARLGVDTFYRGDLGAHYVAGLRAAGSVMTTADLAAHETEVVDPLAAVAFGHEVLTAPPNSQGYVLLALLKAMEAVSRSDACGATDQDAATCPGAPTSRATPTPAAMIIRSISPHERPPDPLGPEASRLACLFRLVSDDRDAYLCDPRRHAVPLDTLLGDDRARRLAEAALADGRTPEPVLPDAAPPRAGGDTIACVAADSHGWAITIIQSVYHAFGAAILEPETGIVAHDRGACFSLDPSSPNLLEGGKRPLHTLMPVMVRRDSRLALVAGTMGGEAQPQIHAQILCRLLRPDATDLATAVAAPRWICDEGAILAETDVPPACLAALRTVGMPLKVLSHQDETVGHAQYVRLGLEGPLEAASDPRADGAGTLITV